MTIQQIIAYQAKDGKQFFSLEESQTYARRAMYGGLYNAMLKADPTFARLDKEMWIDAQMAYGLHLAKVAQDTLAPAVLPKEPTVVVHQLQPNTRKVEPSSEPRWAEDFRRPGADPLVAARNVSRAEEEAARVLERELANGVA